MDKATVLVVDDDPSVCRLVELRFQLDGFDVVSALSSEEALRLARERRPDAIVLDVMMPGMDGFEVCRQIRQEEGDWHPVIIMLTARTGTEFMVAGLAAGADDYVVKPPNLDELVERVRSRLRQEGPQPSLTLAGLPGGAGIAAELGRRLDTGGPVAVLCVDLDGFEVYNRRYGYERGDALLEWLAGLLVDLSRRWPGTFVGRLGSDDFIVVTDPGAVDGLSERFREEYARVIAGFYDADDSAQGWIEVPGEGERPERHSLLNFSIGATTTGHRAVDSAQELLQLAIEMNRYAKFRRENTIVVGPL